MRSRDGHLISRAVIACAGLLAVAPAAEAARDWRALPVPFGSGQTEAGAEFARDGTLFARYIDASGHWLRARAPGGVFGAPQALPGAGSGRTVGFGPGGTMTVLRGTGGDVVANVRSAGPAGTFGADDVVGPSSTVTPGLDIAPDGAALAAWKTADDKLRYAERAASAATFGHPVVPTGDPAVSDWLGQLGLAWPVLEDDGGAALVFATYDGSYTFHQAVRSGPGAFGAPSVLQANVLSPVLAANDAGAAAFVWKSGAQVRARFRQPNGAFGADELVFTASGQNAAIVWTAAVVLHDGRVMAAWHSERLVQCGAQGMQTVNFVGTRVRSAAGTWGAATETAGAEPVLAAAPTGDVVLLTYRVGNGGTAHGDPCAADPGVAAYRGPVAGFTPAATVPLPDSRTNLNLHAALAPDGGDAFAAWETTTSSAVYEDAVSTGGGGAGTGGGDPSTGGDATPTRSGSSGRGPSGPQPPRPPLLSPNQLNADPFDLAAGVTPVRQVLVDLGSGQPPTRTRFDVVCNANGCDVGLSPTVVTRDGRGRARAAAARTVRTKLRTVRAKLRRGERRRMVVTVNRTGMRRIRRALRTRGTARLVVSPTVNGIRRRTPFTVRLTARR